ncbi:hypothetical protein PROFUN_05587 [Planoprotostelium fungivorum]|uniref:Methyltransferase domain-containing protein n=1 Tax=Planoprotostelium fungivorum TaxID=1890364 RepID=A0A2P6N061_9EUKA|nr:hypothetical protein PROFUN_05587 [Planoprotostelium fungivorum]
MCNYNFYVINFRDLMSSVKGAIRAITALSPLWFFDVRQLAGISQEQIDGKVRTWIFTQILNVKGFIGSEGKLNHQVNLIQRPEKDREYYSFRPPWLFTLSRDYLIAPKGLDARLTQYQNGDSQALVLDKFQIHREVRRMLYHQDMIFRLVSTALLLWGLWPRKVPTPGKIPTSNIVKAAMRVTVLSLTLPALKRLQHFQVDKKAYEQLNEEEKEALPKIMRETEDDRWLPNFFDSGALKFLRSKSLQILRHSVRIFGQYYVILYEPTVVTDTEFRYVLNQRDDVEWERLRLQSRPIWECAGNCFVFSIDPKEVRSVLDLGCGSGEWLVSTSQTELQGATDFCGLDQSSTLFPDTVPLNKDGNRNFDLREGDLTDVKTFPAEWKQKFDLVNMRLVLMWIPRERWSGLAQVLRFVTKPGGWFQSIDFAATEDRASPSDRWGVRLLNHTFRQWLRMKSDVHHHPEEIMDMVRGHLTLSAGNWMTCKFEERVLLFGAAHPQKGDKNIMIPVNVIRRAQLAKWFGNGYHQRGDEPMDGIPKDDAEYDELVADFERECIERGSGIGFMMTSARRSLHDTN